MARTWTEPMEWSNEGVAPSNTLKTNGFVGGYKPPAGVFNYFLHKENSCIKELQKAIDEDNLTTATHIANKIISETGVHGLRYYNGVLSYKDSDGTWQELNAGVGKSLEGKEVQITSTETVTAEEGAEIFNDVRDILYSDGIREQGNAATGAYSHAEGTLTTSSNIASHAEGYLTKAGGGASHAEGASTTASGDYSHAEGYNTTASGENSHAEGVGTTASYTSHAEGYNTKASASFSHAEGVGTTASGQKSHAEGASTTASGTISHAEGTSTTASGNYSHAEGANTTSKGESSHAEGNNTKALASFAHSEGDNTIASGSSSHAEGASTTASNSSSHAEGYLTTSGGEYSHAEGRSSKKAIIAFPEYTASSTAEQILNAWSSSNPFSLAHGSSSHVEGEDCLAIGEYSHAEGHFARAKGIASHAEGSHTLSTGDCSHSEGHLTGTTGKSSHAEGEQSRSSGDYSHSEGYVSSSYGKMSHAEGSCTSAFGNASHSEGSSFLSTYVPQINSSTTLDEIIDKWNENKFSLSYGVSSHVEGKNCLSIGNNSHTEGEQTIAYGNNSHSEGYQTTAKSDYSHAEGNSTTATGNNSHSEGTSTSKATDKISNLSSETTRNDIEVAWASNKFSLAHGENSHVGGKDCIAFGAQTHAEGFQTRAYGNNSFAVGTNTVANPYQFVAGKNNTLSNGCASADDQSSSNSIFVVGYGTSTTSANALRITASGKCYGAQAFGSSGADYAEFFEWKDGNNKNEDRRGRFVTLDGEKIRLANSKDDYILGVVSASPFIVGDIADEWHGKYMQDVFGERLTETVDVEEKTEIISEEVKDEDGNVIQEAVTRLIPAHKETRFIINPEYKGDVDYRNREDRKEWSPVGMIGKLVVVDDGTCQENGYCKVSSKGIATHSDDKTKFRVMTRIDGTHIRVLIK